MLGSRSWPGNKTKGVNQGSSLIAITGTPRRAGASYAEDLVRVKILSDDGRSFLIGVSMEDKERVEMLLFLV